VFQEYERQPFSLKAFCVVFYNTLKLFCAGAAVVYDNRFKRRSCRLLQHTFKKPPDKPLRPVHGNAKAYERFLPRGTTKVYRTAFFKTHPAL
jgi:hypothetical protein